MSAAALNQELLEAAVESFAEDELTPLRKMALARFSENGFPSVRHENWRYTNLSPAVDLSNSWLSATTGLDSKAPAPGAGIDDWTGDIDAHWIVARSGMFDPASIAALSSLQKEGIAITMLSESADSVRIDIDDPLSSFNASLLNDGILIRVSKGTKIKKPIGLLVLDDASTSSAVSQTRCIIDVGENADIQIVELLASQGSSPHFANSVIQLDLAAGAKADFVRIQACSEEHLQIGRISAQLQEDALLNYATIDVGGKLIRNDIVAKLVGARCKADISGVYLADGKQHVDNHLVTDHAVGPARSVQNFRGIIGGHARCVFNGKAIVREGADGSDAEQSNHNLLISDTAEIDTKPELEIFADDVKCSHGATVGQLDKSALFYLRSRGLSEEQAAVLLTRAFAGHILKLLPIEGVKKYVDQLIQKKLDAMTEVPGK